MQLLRSVFMAFVIMVVHEVSILPITQAATASDDGFGFYSPRIWKNKDGQTAELSICDCDYDPRCFGERILFRKPSGGFVIIPRIELHPDSLKRIDSGLKKMVAQEPANRSNIDWLNWRGRNGVELSLKLIAADGEMVAFVDRNNEFKITAIENLDDASKVALTEVAIQKFTRYSGRLVAMIDPRPFEKKILDGIDARAGEIKAIGLKNNAASESDIDAWFLEAKQGITFKDQSVEWRVPVQDGESIQGLESDLRAMLFNQLFQLLSLPTADFEELKNASLVKAYKKEDPQSVPGPASIPLPATDPSNLVPGVSEASSGVAGWELAGSSSGPDALSRTHSPSLNQESIFQTSTLNDASHGLPLCDRSCFNCEETVYESRCRLIGWLRRLR